MRQRRRHLVCCPDWEVRRGLLKIAHSCEGRNLDLRLKR